MDSGPRRDEKISGVEIGRIGQRDVTFPIWASPGELVNFRPSTTLLSTSFGQTKGNCFILRYPNFLEDPRRIEGVSPGMRIISFSILPTFGNDVQFEWDPAAQ
jgi:hypothetical protein